MKKSLLFIIISMAFFFAGADAIAQDTKHADAHVHESVHPLLDAEAIRVVTKSQKWKPAKKDGKPVRVSYTMPVMFYFSN